MSRNGSGIYVLPAGQPVITGTTISSTTHNTLMTDLANTLTTSLATDGQTAMSANLPMGGNKLTSLGAATVAGDAARYEQVGALAIAQGSAAAGPLAASGITGAVAVGANSIQLGSSTTDMQNFLFKTNVDGTGKFARGAVGGLGDILLWDELGNLTFPKAPTSPKLAGEIVQMITFASDAGSSTTSTTIVNLSSSVKTFTPRSANSILLLSCSFQGNAALLASTNTLAQFAITEAGAALGTVSVLGVATASGGSQTNAPCIVTARVTNTALTVRSFALGGYTNNSGAAATGSGQIFTITEIQK